MLISEKMTLFIAAWMVFVFFVTIDAILEVFFVFIFIGFLIAKVFTDRFTLTNLRFKMNVLIFVFFIVFIFLIGKKIISFLSI